MNFVATIDGPSAAGKSTTARAVARAIGALYLDTGALYRALAWKSLELGVAAEEGPALDEFLASTRVGLSDSPEATHVWLDGVDVADRIRTPEVSEVSSRLAALPSVRRKLVEVQRVLASEGAVVAEGRDLGTVVFPDADVKIYLDAEVEARAKRRADELTRRGIPVPVGDVADELERRDDRDRTRAESPLEAAPGAIRVDTTSLTREQQVRRVLEIVRASPRCPTGPGAPAREPGGGRSGARGD